MIPKSHVEKRNCSLPVGFYRLSCFMGELIQTAVKNGDIPEYVDLTAARAALGTGTKSVFVNTTTGAISVT